VPSGGGGGGGAAAAPGGAPAAAAVEEKKEEKEEEKVGFSIFLRIPLLPLMSLSRKSQTTTWASVYSIDHVYICKSGMPRCIRLSAFACVSQSIGPRLFNLSGDFHSHLVPNEYDGRC
jgi:hypothetical protein